MPSTTRERLEEQVAEEHEDVGMRIGMAESREAPFAAGVVDVAARTAAGGDVGLAVMPDADAGVTVVKDPALALVGDAVVAGVDRVVAMAEAGDEVGVEEAGVVGAR